MFLCSLHANEQTAPTMNALPPGRSRLPASRFAARAAFAAACALALAGCGQDSASYPAQPKPASPPPAVAVPSYAQGPKPAPARPVFDKVPAAPAQTQNGPPPSPCAGDHQCPSGQYCFSGEGASGTQKGFCFAQPDPVKLPALAPPPPPRSK